MAVMSNDWLATGTNPTVRGFIRHTGVPGFRPSDFLAPPNLNWRPAGETPAMLTAFTLFADPADPNRKRYAFATALPPGEPGFDAYYLSSDAPRIFMLHYHSETHRVRFIAGDDGEGVRWHFVGDTTGTTDYFYAPGLGEPGELIFAVADPGSIPDPQIVLARAGIEASAAFTAAPTITLPDIEASVTFAPTAPTLRAAGHPMIQGEIRLHTLPRGHNELIRALVRLDSTQIGTGTYDLFSTFESLEAGTLVPGSDISWPPHTHDAEDLQRIRLTDSGNLLFVSEHITDPNPSDIYNVGSDIAAFVYTGGQFFEFDEHFRSDAFALGFRGAGAALRGALMPDQLVLLVVADKGSIKPSPLEFDIFPVGAVHPISVVLREVSGQTFLAVKPGSPLPYIAPPPPPFAAARFRVERPALIATGTLIEPDDLEYTGDLARLTLGTNELARILVTQKNPAFPLGGLTIWASGDISGDTAVGSIDPDSDTTFDATLSARVERVRATSTNRIVLDLPPFSVPGIEGNPIAALIPAWNEIALWVAVIDAQGEQQVFTAATGVEIGPDTDDPAAYSIAWQLSPAAALAAATGAQVLIVAAAAGSVEVSPQFA